MSSLAWAGFRLAVGTLTVIPVGDIGRVTPAVARAAMLAAPLAVLPLALGASLICWLAEVLRLPWLVAAALVLGGLALGTRGMHLDGLTDTIDGLSAGWTRERALEVMRKGDVGPLGVAGLVIVLIAQAAAIGALTGPGWLLVAWAVVASRVACTVLTTRGLPPARPDGLGAVVANVVPRSATALSVLVMTACGVLAAVVAGAPWWLPLVAVAVSGLALWWLARRALRVIGGVNGDVIGAGVEVTFTALLVILTVGVAA